MATQKRRYHPKKWAGVYVYETSEVFNGSPDLCFYITFKSGRRLIWEKVGKTSEGYGPDVAAEIRAERIKAIRHGEEVKTARELRREQAERDKLFAEIADAYFDIKGPTLKGLTTDRNRYLKHLKPLFGKRSVSEITPQMVEELRKSLSERKPATLWNTLGASAAHHQLRSENQSLPRAALPDRNAGQGQRSHRAPDAGGNARISGDSPAHGPPAMWAICSCWPFFTGMRRGEIFKLRDEDVAFDLKLIRLRDPKGRKTLSIGMSALVEELLRGQMNWAG